jgi:uncharacterized protein
MTGSNILYGVIFAIFLFFSQTLGAPETMASAPDALPGAPPFHDALIKKIEKMKKIKKNGPGPRNLKPARHLKPDGSPAYTNRLFLETSPYLLQHAHNPVSWLPWGEEAFEMAKRLNRPIILSVGYSTCHWCHVMEEESFEDMEIAEFVNAHFIAVKVDREQRPDIDSIYMKALNAMTGTGGWPMTLFLTPDGEPFHGGSYFPARDGDRGNMPGFLTLLKRISAAASNPEDWEKIKKTGKLVAETLQKLSVPPPPGPVPGRERIDAAIETIQKNFDAEDGGLKTDIKFPSSFPLRLFFRAFNRSGEPHLLAMTRLTLDKMRAGGMYDHVGDGFHRYSTDSRWVVPHFEKMLYDNALLAVAYTEAAQLSGDDAYGNAARKILDYMLREMRSPEGAFYSATDADSLTPEGKSEEGYFFTWTAGEIDRLFPGGRAAMVKRYFSVDMDGTEYRHILHVSEPEEKIAAAFGVSVREMEAIIEEAKKILYAERAKRPAPGLDDKVIASWNALAISALAKAGFAFDRPDYIHAARKCAAFVFEKLFKDGRLFRSHRDGKTDHPAFLEDYAFLTGALLDLFEADFDLSWFEKALELDRILEAEFEDGEKGGFFMTSKNEKRLISREKPGSDGAIPSGNASAVMNLIRMGVYTGEKRYMDRADRVLKSFSGALEKSPESMAETLLALDLLTGKRRELVIVFPKGNPKAAEPFLSAIRKRFLPGMALIVAEEGEKAREISALMPSAKGKTLINRKAAAYFCENSVCRLPAPDPDTLEKEIRGHFKNGPQNEGMDLSH